MSNFGLSNQFMRKFTLMLFIGQFILNCSARYQSQNEQQQIQKEYKIPDFSNDNVKTIAYQIALVFKELDDIKKNHQQSNNELLVEKFSQVESYIKNSETIMTYDDLKKMTDWVNQLMIDSHNKNN